YLVATRRDPLGETRTVVALVPAPPGGLVDQAAVVALAETVKGQRAARGMLVTSGEIDAAGLAALDVELTLVDGARFTSMIAEHLRPRVAAVEGSRGLGAPAVEAVDRQRAAHAPRV